MSLYATLADRAKSKCELCGATEQLTAYAIPPHSGEALDEHILACQTCLEQIEDSDKIDVHHWHCLSDSMWSQTSAVQVMAWRMLQQLSGESWAQDALDILYLDEQTLARAKATGGSEDEQHSLRHMDSNGVQLSAGDTVTLTKDLNVKGTRFTAKRGTAVRGISLVTDNAGHIEGRINGQQIVILTQFVKKT